MGIGKKLAVSMVIAFMSVAFVFSCGKKSGQGTSLDRQSEDSRVFYANIADALVAEAVKLPEAQTSGGPGIFDIMKNRVSTLADDFTVGKVSSKELSTLLWAATGQNRPNSGWTIPLARSSEPYCRVYVTGEEGTFLYDWKTNSLVKTSNEDARTKVSSRDFLARISHVLIFVTDGKAMETLRVRDGDHVNDWPAIAMGTMMQQVYLAAEAMGIGTRYISNLNNDVIHSVCGLESVDIPLGIMPIGKR